LLADLGPLVPAAQRDLAAAMLGYHVQAALRGEPQEAARRCGPQPPGGRPGH